VQGKKLADAGSEYAVWYRSADMRATSDATLPLHTEWFPGWHVAVLRAGVPDGDTAFYLNGYAMHGHRHYDTLGILYYAGGKELASDRGYIWDDPRNAWTKSTLAHNIVTVDGSNQNTKQRESHLDLFAVAPGIEVVQASANAYTQCDRYQRTCVMVQLPEGETYVVDIFRVQGGKKHQYGFNGNGNLIALGTEEPEPIDEKIKWLDHLRAVAPTGPFTATWEYQDMRMDLMVLNPIDRVIVADAPGWRSDRGSELDAAPIQQLLAERTSADGATTSQYVTVIVSYAGDESPVRSAHLLANDSTTGLVAVEVERAGRTDILVSSLDGTPRQIDSVTLAGQFGFVSRGASGKTQQAYLLAGTRLQCGDVELTRETATTGLKVASVEDRTFHLVDILPEGSVTAGQYVLGGGTGYEIESAGQRTITVRDYPIVACDEITLLHDAFWQVPVR
ncbi:MAG: heparinase II/III family protein, partial [Pirellulales bacterium]